MLTWLGQRPANKRRAARPAAVAAELPIQRAPKSEPYVPTAEDELPPPFFADPDEAFLDALEPPPLPAREAMPRTTLELEAKIARDLAALPPFPEPESFDRGIRLREILGDLDRIAGDVCVILTPQRSP